jgi:YHS domain-containing protein
MKQLFALALICSLFTLAQRTPGADRADSEAAKDALKELQDFIGGWKGNGSPDKPRPSPTDPVWSETLNWSWRFKGDDAWLTLDVKNGKHLKGGEMRYLPGKKAYQLTVTDADGKKLVFEGRLRREVLTLERVDPQTKETQQLKMNVAGDGVIFNLYYARRAGGTTLWKKEYRVRATKEGESLAAREKKVECVVSGGAGTMPVSYKGETYYVCCSGCRDAFNENPEKYIAEFKAKKAGKK